MGAVSSGATARCSARGAMRDNCCACCAAQGAVLPKLPQSGTEPPSGGGSATFRHGATQLARVDEDIGGLHTGAVVPQLQLPGGGWRQKVHAMGGCGTQGSRRTISTCVDSWTAEATGR